MNAWGGGDARPFAGEIWGYPCGRRASPPHPLDAGRLSKVEPMRYAGRHWRLWRRPLFVYRATTAAGPGIKQVVRPVCIERPFLAIYKNVRFGQFETECLSYCGVCFPVHDF